MSLAQDIRNAFDSTDRDAIGRLLPRVVALELAVRHDKRPISLTCSKCGCNRLDRPCPLSAEQAAQCPGSGTAIA